MAYRKVKEPSKLMQYATTAGFVILGMCVLGALFTVGFIALGVALVIAVAIGLFSALRSSRAAQWFTKNTKVGQELARRGGGAARSKGMGGMPEGFGPGGEKAPMLLRMLAPFVQHAINAAAEVNQRMGEDIEYVAGEVKTLADGNEDALRAVGVLHGIELTDADVESMSGETTMLEVEFTVTGSKGHGVIKAKAESHDDKKLVDLVSAVLKVEGRPEIKLLKKRRVTVDI